MVLLIVMLNQKMSVFLLDSALCSYSLSDMDSNQKKAYLLGGAWFYFMCFTCFSKTYFIEIDPRVFIKWITYLKLEI